MIGGSAESTSADARWLMCLNPHTGCARPLAAHVRVHGEVEFGLGLPVIVGES